MQLGYTCDNRKLHNVSLGQGQEKVAEEALKVAAKGGHWVILQVCFISEKLGKRLCISTVRAYYQLWQHQVLRNEF